MNEAPALARKTTPDADLLGERLVAWFNGVDWADIPLGSLRDSVLRDSQQRIDEDSDNGNPLIRMEVCT